MHIGPSDRQADGRLVEAPDLRIILNRGIPMKTIAIAAAALLMISVSAHAGTYSVEGITVHVREGCRSSSCVSVYAPGYGSYNGGRRSRSGIPGAGNTGPDTGNCSAGSAFECRAGKMIFSRTSFP